MDTKEIEGLSDLSIKVLKVILDSENWHETMPDCYLALCVCGNYAKWFEVRCELVKFDLIIEKYHIVKLTEKGRKFI